MSEVVKMGWGTTIFFGALASFGIGSCIATTTGTFPEYHYNGTLGSEQVRFEESPWTGYSHIRVTKEDGSKVEYILLEGEGHSLTLEEIAVRDEAKETRFSTLSQNPDIAAVVEKAKPDAAKYLQGIIDAKVQQYK